jgi:DNA-binding transcriptional regulator GbsR (MarR family)
MIDHPDAKAFVLHWGEMGSRWGVNRSVGQIHALLFLSHRPLIAEEMCDTLKLARSNISTGLRELQSYGLVRLVHNPGDRRDHFVAEGDPWEMLLRVAAERKRRELDPTIAFLGELSERLSRDTGAPPHLRERVQRLHQFTTDMSDWYEDVRALPKSTLFSLVKQGARIARAVMPRWAQG